MATVANPIVSRPISIATLCDFIHKLQLNPLFLSLKPNHNSIHSFQHNRTQSLSLKIILLKMMEGTNFYNRDELKRLKRTKNQRT